MKRNIAILFSFILYLSTWFVSQKLCGYWGSILFGTFYLIIFSLLIPFILIKKYAITMRLKLNKKFRIAGILFLIIITLFSIFPAGTLKEISHHNPGFEVIIKYCILFLPMSFGISMFCFYLFPLMIDETSIHRVIKSGLIIVISSLTSGISFYIDTLGNVDMFFIMAMMGLFFGIGFLLTKSFFILWVFFFINMMAHTLGEAKYYDYDWSILAIEIIVFLFLFSSVIIKKYFDKKKVKSLPNY